MSDSFGNLDPKRCLRSVRTAALSRLIMLREFPRITRDEYKANALATIALYEQDARSFIREAILAGRRKKQ